MSTGAQAGSRYRQVMARLSEALQFGINPSLEGIRALTAALGNPQDSLRCVQVTGTNGKTSVSRMTAALLRAHGLRTGLYTSPHLNSYTERIEIDGAPIGEDLFAAALEQTFAAAEGLGAFTEFELLTAAALWAMRRAGVEWAVLEVGMGGQWDATSVVTPEVAVITGVALDHTDRLGSTREAIASDKAHIIKHGSRVVLGPGCQGVEEILLARAREVGAGHLTAVGIDLPADTAASVSHLDILERPRALDDDLEVRDVGEGTYLLKLKAPAYQAANASVALRAAGAALGHPPDHAAVDRALAGATFPGRFEVLRLRPPLVIDGAHNPDAARMLAAAVLEQFQAPGPLVVLGILADKDAEGIVRALAPAAASFVATENSSPRSMPAGALADLIERVTDTRPAVRPAIGDAVELAASGGLPVLVTGSLYTVGDARALYLPR